MSFPVIETADVQSGTITSNTITWPLTWPTNCVSGDLILVCIATDGPTHLSTGAGSLSKLLAVSSGNNTLHVWVRQSNGTESGNFNFTMSNGEQGGWRIHRITGVYSVPGEIAEVSAGATGASTTPNPDSLDPSGWDVADTLWLAACSVDTSRTISVYPLANNQSADVSGGAGGATLGLCSLNDAVASKDPGTFTISNSDDWVAATIAIRPVGAVVDNAHLIKPNIIVEKSIQSALRGRRF